MNGDAVAVKAAMRPFILTLFFASLLTAQSFQRYDATFSGGMNWDVGANNQGRVTAVNLGATGGIRIMPFFELETGVFGVIGPAGTNCNSSGCITPDSHTILVPFGARVILPLKKDRFELSAGAGGLYENYSTAATVGSFAYSYNGFGGYFKTSAAVALDRRRHVWLGFTPRVILANGANARDRLVLLTGDIGFRF